MISIVYQEMIKPRVLARMAVRCVFVALMCATALGMAQDGASRSDNRPVNLGVVRQAHVEPRTIILPVVDGHGIRFTRLSTDDGLSQTRVSQIVQDDQGFMWFGSQYGLNRYDGYKFKVFKHEPGNRNSLSGVFIYSLFKDRSGSLWIGCEEFLDKFDPVSDTFTHYRIDTTEAQGETVPVTNISQDHTGMLWLSTIRGLVRFDPSTGHIIRYRHDPNNPFSLSSDAIRTTGEDREGTFWVGSSEGLDAFDRDTEKVTLHVPLQNLSETSFYEDRDGVLWIFQITGGGLAVFDRKTNTLTQYSFHEGHLSDALMTGAMTMLEDRDGSLWFGTFGDGLVKFDRQERKFIRYRNDPANPDSLGEDNVTTLFQDREGNIWAGLHMMAPNRFSTRPPLFEKFKHEPGNPNSLSGTMVNGIYEDREGILWISAINALNRVDRKTGKYTFYRTAVPGVSPRPTAIAQDRLGFLWVGSDNHGLTRLDPKTGQFRTFRHSPTDRFSLSSDRVTGLFLDHAGTLWATTHDGLDRFDPATSHFTVHKLDQQSAAQIDIEVKEDRQGALWIGTHSAGLERFDPTTGRFTAIYKHNANDPTSLSNDRVNSVHFDHSGTMWVGTQEGLDKFDPRTGKFKTYYEQDGLSGNGVSCILEDERGRIWISTNNGLSVFDPSRETFKNYSVADGLPGADLTGWGACYRSSSGEMFFGGFSGGVAFYPDKVVDSTYVPPVVLTDFRLFDRPMTVGADSPLKGSIGYTDALSLSHDQNVFSLEFSALSYFNPATNRYRYKLDGLDRQWHEVGSNQRLVTYTTLPAATYTFRVQGATSRGAWSEPGVTLHVEVLPPWWSTSWFRVLCTLAAAGTLWMFYKLRVRSIHLRSEQLALINAKLEVQIAERKQAEEALRQAQADLTHANRVSSMGELTASLAHEIKQPIAATITNADTCLRWLARDQPDLEKARAAASRIVQDGRRAGEIVNGVRLLFQKGTLQLELVDLNDIIRAMTLLLHSEATRFAVFVRTELSADLPQVMGDRVQLQQVLMNLMMNGIDAMKDVDGTRELTIQSQRGEDGQVMISVSDTGVGLPPQQADKIFNAFFTTKTHGTGMGLRISRSIVESHGGRLWAGDNFPRGATFQFTLPATVAAHA